MQRHRRSPGAHEKYEELVNEHYKEPVSGLFDDVTASVLRTLVSDKSESDVEVNIRK